jgi:hypothetical protein
MRACFFRYKKVLVFSNLDCCVSFRGLFDLERNFITLSELIEIDSFEVVGVEEKVISAFLGDESEILVRQFFDCTLHNNVKIKLV